MPICKAFVGFLFCVWSCPGSLYSSGIFIWRSLGWEASLLILEEVIFGYQPAFLGPSFFQGFVPQCYTKQTPEEAKFCSPDIHSCCPKGLVLHLSSICCFDFLLHEAWMIFVYLANLLGLLIFYVLGTFWETIVMLLCQWIMLFTVLEITNW